MLDDNGKRCVESKSSSLGKMAEKQKCISDNKLSELYGSIQKFLMKKEQEYGPLSSLLSRATKETSDNIDRIIQGISEIYKSYEILPVNEQGKPEVDLKISSSVIASFQVMLLNTNFYSQYRLAEDTLFGHQVGLWPAMSPYLLIQIVWAMRCEELLPRFVLYLPLELSIEILNITIPCLAELKFERAVNLVVQLANYMYKVIYRLNITGTQIYPVEEHMRQFLAHFQELLDQLTNPRVTRLCDLPEQLRYERQGIILKNIIRMSNLCTVERTHGGIQDNLGKLYTLTFGNEVCGKLPPKLLLAYIDEMDQSLMMLLMNHLKEVNCNMYLTWAEVEDRENRILSLQRAVVIECVYFMKVIQLDIKLKENQELQMCLSQLIGSNSQPQLTLQEICDSVRPGNREDLKELLLRYREWDESILWFLSMQEKQLSNENFEVLFQYLKYTFSVKQHSTQEKLRLQILVMEILLKRNLGDLYKITLSYVLHHYNDNFLQELYDHNRFHVLMRQASGAWREPFFLMSLLVHILHSPKEVLMALVNMTISVSNDVMCTSQQLMMLQPFLCLKVDQNQSLLTKLLYDLHINVGLWDLQKYTTFITVMLRAFVSTPEDIITNVIIRYLMERPFDQNVSCILISACKIIDTYTLKFGVMELCLAVVRKISNWRKCEPTKSRFMVKELLSNLLRVLKKCVQKPHLMSVEQKRRVLNTVLPHIEPLDKAALSPLLYLVESNVLSIFDDYARRCYAVRRKYKQARRQQHDFYLRIDHIRLEKQDFARHMILHATNAEYNKNCLEMTIKYWFFFGWVDELDAYDNVTRITMEAIRIGLEHAENVPADNFHELLRNCIRFSESFSWEIEKPDKVNAIVRILLKNLSLVTQSTKGTRHWNTYNTLIARLKDIVDSEKTLPDFLYQIETFITNITGETDTRKNENNEAIVVSPEIVSMIDSYKFICGCFSIPGTEKHHRFIEKIESIIFSEDFGYLNYHPL